VVYFRSHYAAVEKTFRDVPPESTDEVQCDPMRYTERLGVKPRSWLKNTPAGLRKPELSSNGCESAPSIVV